MSEEKQPTLQELQQAYGQASARYGDLAYRIKCLKEEMELLVPQLKEINQKAFKLQQAQADIKPKETVAAPYSDEKLAELEKEVQSKLNKETAAQ